MIQRPGDIENWLRRAGPGDRESYGRGERPPRELVRAMQPLIRSELLRPVAKREGREFLFLIERTTRPLHRMGRTSCGPVRRAKRRSVASLMFNLLVQAARRGVPCPSNAQLAQRCGLQSKQAASHQLHLLVAAGRIAIAGGTGGEARMVTVLIGKYAGRRTADPSMEQGGKA